MVKNFYACAVSAHATWFKQEKLGCRFVHYFLKKSKEYKSNQLK